MENKKKTKQEMFEDQIIKLRDWTDTVHNLIAERLNIERMKTNQQHENLLLKLTEVQTPIIHLKDAIAKRSAESTALHDQSTKSNDRHFEKLRDLIIDNSNKTKFIEDSNKVFAAALAEQSDHIHDLIAHTDSVSFFIRILCVLNAVGLAFLVMIFYRLLTRF